MLNRTTAEFLVIRCGNESYMLCNDDNTMLNYTPFNFNIYATIRNESNQYRSDQLQLCTSGFYVDYYKNQTYGTYFLFKAYVSMVLLKWPPSS